MEPRIPCGCAAGDPGLNISGAGTAATATPSDALRRPARLNRSDDAPKGSTWI